MTKATKPPCKKGITTALWDGIKNNFDMKTIEVISLNPNAKHSVSASKIEKHCFDSFKIELDHVCAVDMIEFNIDEIILTEFKDGGIKKVDIYRKAIESILVVIKTLHTAPFNPFDFNFKYQLVYTESSAPSQGAQMNRERSLMHPNQLLLAPLKNHLYREAVAIPGYKYAPKT